MAGDEGQAGRAPSGFTATLTGQGRPGNWVVTAAPDAPSERHVLAQTDVEHTAYRFPVIVADSPSMADVDLAVRFSLVLGTRPER